MSACVCVCVSACVCVSSSLRERFSGGVVQCVLLFISLFHVSKDVREKEEKNTHSQMCVCVCAPVCAWVFVEDAN